MMEECLTFEGNTVLITGATGLIGKALVRAFLRINDIKVIALVRNIDKANRVFDEVKCPNLDIIECDISDWNKLDIINDVDYIIHAASLTSSKDFINKPVEVSLTSLNGTINMLNYAKKCKAKKVVYLSSMEVYGYPLTEDKIYENSVSNIDTMIVRSSYPESKRMCENLCVSYYSEYGVPTVVLRLTQTFGRGVDYNDNRVFAEFARCVIEGRDIVLKTKGETKRSYLDVEDAVNAIMIALIKGQSGEVYNVANESSYCSIYEMAKMVAKECASNSIKVRIEEEECGENGYAPILKMNLDASKMQKLGWSVTKSLKESYISMIEDMKINCKMC